MLNTNNAINKILGKKVNRSIVGDRRSRNNKPDYSHLGEADLVAIMQRYDKGSKEFDAASKEYEKSRNNRYT